MLETKALWGTVILMEVETGDIKAISNYLEGQVPFTCGEDTFHYETYLTKGMKSCVVFHPICWGK